MRYVYGYCNKCGQATPHKIFVVFDKGWEDIEKVLARCLYCANEIEIEWETVLPE